MLRMKISNGVDSVEQMFKDKEAVIEFMQKDGVILKQALKALSEAVPVEVEVKKDVEDGHEVKTYSAPKAPFRPKGTVAEPCPQCQEKALYTNTSKSPGNFGKRYKKCSACGYVDWWECVKVGRK